MSRPTHALCLAALMASAPVAALAQEDLTTLPAVVAFCAERNTTVASAQRLDDQRIQVTCDQGGGLGGMQGGAGAAVGVLFLLALGGGGGGPSSTTGTN